MKENASSIDKGVTIASVLCCAVFIVATLISPDAVKGLFDKLFKFFIDNFGWSYLLVVASFVVFCFGIAFSKFGSVKLGKDEDEPEFSLPAWFSMLFAAGMGIGLVFWGVAEPVYHFAGPPFAEAKTAQAGADAMRTTFFHWGLHPWACYAVVAMLLAYSHFRKGNPCQLSWILEPLIGKERVKGLMGRSIDTLAIVVTLFGVATSLGLGAMQVCTGLSKLFGIPNTVTVSILVIVVVTVLYIISAVSGVDKGIKLLSNTNMIMAFGLLVLMLFNGPTVYILKFLIESLGNYAQNIIWLSFFMDTTGGVAKHAGYEWIGAWTVFYWAWWLTWAPFVGAFIARISKGRTIKEFVMGALLAPTLLCAIWFSIMGGTAIHMELADPSVGIADATFKDVTTAIFVMFDHFPMGFFLSLMSMIIVCIFFITSADSATYVVGVMSSGGDLNPKNSLKIFWGLLCSTIAAMLLLTGGLKAIQTVSFVVSFPFMILMVFMIVAFLRSLASERV
ncbi:Glycine betaine transporter OpuD [Desulfamplus magnetovallimortis]|uniref:Glycine betaine transporter OpuD n=1 Tax=Desulfamplus magnetovallimortis TaxID=1246637 RepID=A0A1W1HBV8_9BACT|nr:BCCT family transporter [Desulfamplus magnetovallimortis]SLM29929.1 Glycine betaine transporter OpuD [Desulfamplus magnetovallimortis]